MNQTIGKPEVRDDLESQQTFIARISLRAQSFIMIETIQDPFRDNEILLPWFLKY